MKLFDFDKLINTLTGYIETRIELLKIDIREGLSVAITKLVLYAIVGLMGFFVLMFLFLGLAQWLNQLLESTFLGHLLVAAFFALCLSLVLMWREKILADISKKINTDTLEDKTESDV